MMGDICTLYFLHSCDLTLSLLSVVHSKAHAATKEHRNKALSTVGKYGWGKNDRGKKPLIHPSLPLFCTCFFGMKYSHFWVVLCFLIDSLASATSKDYCPRSLSWLWNILTPWNADVWRIMLWTYIYTGKNRWENLKWMGKTHEIRLIKRVSRKDK